MTLKDIGLVLNDQPGALADFGQTLGAAGVSLEGGGVFTHQGAAVAHFLVDDAERAREALHQVDIGPVVISEVVLLRLDQEVPGQLGRFTRRLGDAGINILVQYSDHAGQLVIIVDPAQYAECAEIAAAWDPRAAQAEQADRR